MSAPAGGPEGTPVLAIDNLHTYFRTPSGTVRAVDGVSFSIGRGEILGVVGESGCGKSMTALSVMGLVPNPPGRIEAGSIRLHDRELVGASEEELRKLRGDRMSMIFQEPMTSLDPVMRIGRQIAEMFVVHRGAGRRSAQERAVEMLERVRIPEPVRRARSYPHQLSGGMRQRVMIAIALACEPDLLIADEPTTALDVTIQAQILRLMLDLRSEFGTAIMLITHDLGVIAETADRVVVMYAGRKVEEAPVEQLFRAPRHPYTAGLLGSVPKLDRSGGEHEGRLVEIKGVVPRLDGESVGCRFAPRCPLASERCRMEEPPLTPIENGHVAACWHSERTTEIIHA